MRERSPERDTPSFSYGICDFALEEVCFWEVGARKETLGE